MEKQCGNCAHAKSPTKRSACNVKALHELADACKMKQQYSGLPYCDDFKPIYIKGLKK